MEKIIEDTTSVFIIQLLRYVVLAGIAFLVLYVFFSKRFVNAKIQNRDAGKADYIREILHSLQSTFILSLVGYLLVATRSFGKHMHIYYEIDKYGWWWIGVSAILSLIIQDTYFYWMHRTMHHKALFKYAHLLHHKSVNPTPWASYSFHFFEAWFEGAILIVVAFIIPIHPLGIFLFTIISLFINVYLHLGYEIAPRWFRNSFLFSFVITSVYHNVHHSRFRGNYGLYFRYWDKWMKTENPDYVKAYDKVQEARFGTKDKVEPIAQHTPTHIEHQLQD